MCRACSAAAVGVGVRVVGACVGSVGACACLQGSETSGKKRDSSSSEVGQFSDAAEELYEEEVAPVPRPRLPKNQSSNGAAPPLPSRKGRKKVSELFRQQSPTPPPLPCRPSTLTYRNSEDPPPLPSRPRSEEGILVPTPPPKPLMKTPSSPMLGGGLPQDPQNKKRSSGGEYIWIRPAWSPEGDSDEPPPIPPLPANSYQSEDCASGAGPLSMESCGQKQQRTGGASCTNNILYDYIIPLNSPSESPAPPLPAKSHQSENWASDAGLPGPESVGQEQPQAGTPSAYNLIYGCSIPLNSPPEPPLRHDSLFTDLHGDSTPVSSAPASPEVPRAGLGNGAVPKTARLPVEAQEQDAPGPATPPRPHTLEFAATARTGSPARQHAATQVRRTF